MERRWRLHAWVLMSNHYHLLVETPEIGLSRGMHWLNSKYAETFNTRHERVGHLFQGRFKAILVEREGHLLELLRYIVLNPVRAGTVRCVDEYAWSSYRATAGLSPSPRWLETEWTLAQFGGSQEAYRQFVAAGAAAPYHPRDAITGQIYLGSAKFCRRMQKLADSAPRSREIPAAQREFARPTFKQIVRLVAQCFDVPAEELREKSRGWARKALAQLAVEEAGVTLRFIARWMGVSDWAVSKMRIAGAALYATNDGYRDRVDRIKEALS